MVGENQCWILGEWASELQIETYMGVDFGERSHRYKGRILWVPLEHRILNQGNLRYL